MTHAQAQQALDDYVGERLSAEQRRAFEAHLAHCQDCRHAAAARLELRREIAALPRTLAPRRDLWPGISSRLTARPADARASMPLHRRVWWRRRLWPSMAAAALAAATLIVLLNPGALRPTAPAPPPSAHSLGPLEVTPAPDFYAAERETETTAIIAAIEAEYRGIDEQYQRLTAEQAGNEGNPILELFAANLRIVNQAVVDAREAWQANPQSPQLVRMLVAAYQAKATLQGRASEALTQG